MSDLAEMLASAKLQGYKEGLEDAYNRLDEGVCDLCQYEYSGCYKVCGKEGWERGIYMDWLKERISGCMDMQIS